MTQQRMTAAEYRAQLERAPRAKARALPRGQMNALEREYAAHLEARRLRGEVAKWRWESWTVKLAHDVRLTMDFYVLKSDGTIEWHDTKGTKSLLRKSGAKEQVPYVTEDARIKLAQAAKEYPEFRWLKIFRRGTKASPIWSAVEVTT